MQPLIDAIPPYLEATTGRTWIDDATIHPLAKSAASFILQLWFQPKDKDTDKLRNAIDSLLVALQAIGRSMDNE
ncbi:phage gp6-like head-tail connector protein [Clostridium kluyveri]|uniref:phage gp6-like head-tail connector protein n=1 Tax=Clostridium kluyveri TaxID=1534 RepID=UPI001FA83B22|nr:phage gp6-like head-tail connector protein [Clostridium kluyveri]